jgi:hypothetical protein
MKRYFITTVILFFCFALSLSASAVVKFEATELDFGEIEAGKVADLEFKFENTGDETLIIKNIAASCGCTTTKLDKKEYQPGEKGSIPVKFYSQGYNGKVLKTITVSTNDKDNVYTRLRITGKVNLTNFAAIEVVGSDRIEFKEVTLGKEYSESLKIKNSGTIDLRIIEVTHSPDVYPIFSKKVLRPEEECDVKVVFTPMETGRFATFIKIRSNAYRERLVIIKVSAEVK